MTTDDGARLFVNRIEKATKTTVTLALKMIPGRARAVGKTMWGSMEEGAHTGMPSGDLAEYSQRNVVSIGSPTPNTSSCH